MQTKIAGGVLALIAIFMFIFLFEVVLHVCANFQINNKEYQDLLLIENITKKNNGFVPVRYR